jgi:hypothetical protein
MRRDIPMRHTSLTRRRGCVLFIHIAKLVPRYAWHNWAVAGHGLQGSRLSCAINFHHGKNAVSPVHGYAVVELRDAGLFIAHAKEFTPNNDCGKLRPFNRHSAFGGNEL